MNALNRPLFQRYARRPAPQGPVGIMASSPELMQAAARYNIGGLVERTDIDPSEILKGVTPMPMVQPNPIGQFGMFQAPKNTTQHLEDIGNSVGGIQEDIRRAGVNINTASGNLDTARSTLGIGEPSGVDLATTQPLLGNGFGIPGTPGYGHTTGLARDLNPIQTTTNLAEGGPVLSGRNKVRVRPTVDITQEPIEFQETVTETVVPDTVGGFTEEGLAQEVGKFTTPSMPKIEPEPEPDNSEPAPDNSDADKLAEAEKIGEQAVDENATEEDKNLTPSEEADKIIAGMGKDAPKGTKGKIGAMKDLIKETFGVDASRYDNLKSLNRAMVGFAIAEGGDIASALKQGAAGAAAIEEKSLARDDSMSQMALQQVFAEKLAGMRNAAAMAGKASDYTPERLRQRAIESILRNPDQFDVYNDKTGAVDPAKVQREADILVSAMSNNTVDITKPTATGGEETSVDVPTTPGVRFRDKETGKIMVVGEDGVAREE